MKSLFLLLLLLLDSSVPCPAADPPTRELFALYPVTRENTSEATPFTYYSALNRNPHSGHFKGPAVLSFSDVAGVNRDTTEIQTAPFFRLSFRLSDSGLAKLQSYLQKPKSGELIVIIDGHPYAAVDVPFMRQLVKNREPLFIVFPGPYEQTTDHLLELLKEKLQAALNPARPKQPTPDNSESKVSPKTGGPPTPGKP